MTITVLFTPDEHTSLSSHSWTRHHLILNLMRDVVEPDPGPDTSRHGIMEE